MKNGMIENTKTNTFEKINSHTLDYLKGDSKIDDPQGRKTSLSAQANYFTRVIVVYSFVSKYRCNLFLISVFGYSAPHSLGGCSPKLCLLDV